MSSDIVFDDPTLDDLDFKEFKWDGMEHLLNAVPTENLDPRASVFQRIDLNSLKENDLFAVDDKTRFSFYIPASPPKSNSCTTS